MGIRIAAALTITLAVLVSAALTSSPLSAQEPSRTKIDVPRDDIDKIVLEEAKRDKRQAIEHLKAKVQELNKKHDDLIYEIINVRVKLKRAVDGLGELDPGRKSDETRTGPEGTGSIQQSKGTVLRPRPTPSTARERDELLKKYEDEASVAAKLESEASSMIKYLKDIKISGKK